MFNWFSRNEIPKGFPAGHFYSPIPDLVEVEINAEKIFDRNLRQLPGIDINDAGQVELFEHLASQRNPWFDDEELRASGRYRPENEFFSFGDGTIYGRLLCYLKPQKVIEVGCGYSSALTLDAKERLPLPDLEMLFIEPHSERLRSLLSEVDQAKYQILELPVQDVAIDEFQQLARGDILFIDGSHVAKVGSDVNYLILEVLPQLATGVWVHIHDIFYPFEYPRAWIVDDNRAWTEAYLLRAFLAFNPKFSIRFWNDYFALAHREMVKEKLPIMLQNSGGSIWLEVN